MRLIIFEGSVEDWRSVQDDVVQASQGAQASSPPKDTVPEGASKVLGGLSERAQSLVDALAAVEDPESWTDAPTLRRLTCEGYQPRFRALLAGLRRRERKYMKQGDVIVQTYWDDNARHMRYRLNPAVRELVSVLS